MLACWYHPPGCRKPVLCSIPRDVSLAKPRFFPTRTLQYMFSIKKKKRKKRICIFPYDISLLCDHGFGFSERERVRRKVIFSRLSLYLQPQMAGFTGHIQLLPFSSLHITQSATDLFLFSNPNSCLVLLLLFDSIHFTHSRHLIHL